MLVEENNTTYIYFRYRCSEKSQEEKFRLKICVCRNATDGNLSRSSVVFIFFIFFVCLNNAKVIITYYDLNQQFKNLYCSLINFQALKFLLLKIFKIFSFD